MKDKHKDLEELHRNLEALDEKELKDDHHLAQFLEFRQ
jgi:hypothetical protein